MIDIQHTGDMQRQHWRHTVNTGEYQMPLFIGDVTWKDTDSWKSRLKVIDSMRLVL